MDETNIKSLIEALDKGHRCVVRQSAPGEWNVDVEAKEAILNYFKIQKMVPITEDPPFYYADKIPVKTAYPPNVRIVPPAVVRYGAFVESGAVLMPCYVNIGAYVSSGTMVDNFTLVGSCAFVGKNCHLSAHVTIGGVLEPAQARPVIIEDNCFLGAGTRVLEGVLVRSGAVIAAGVTLTASTKIIDVRSSKPQYCQGTVPANAVVVPGTYEREFSSGKFNVQCALVIGERTSSHDQKLSLNETLRKYNDFAF